VTDPSRTQQHAQRALADLCPWCEQPGCAGEQRWTHDRYDAASETRWRRTAIAPSPLLDQTRLGERGQR
jgi:hypothetical protein